MCIMRIPVHYKKAPKEKTVPIFFELYILQDFFLRMGETYINSPTVLQNCGLHLPFFGSRE